MFCEQISHEFGCAYFALRSHTQTKLHAPWKEMFRAPAFTRNTDRRTSLRVRTHEESRVCLERKCFAHTLSHETLGRVPQVGTVLCTQTPEARARLEGIACVWTHSTNSRTFPRACAHTRSSSLARLRITCFVHGHTHTHLAPAL